MDKILIVEDDGSLNESLVAALTNEYEVRAVNDGAAAVDFLDENEVDLVLLDMVMPGMGGRETYLTLRDVNPRVKVILVSGYALGADAQATLDDGALGFLHKPFAMERITAEIAEALSGGGPQPDG